MQADAEGTLERALAQMDSHLADLNVAIAVAHQGRVVYANRACARLFGYDNPRQLAGTPVVPHIPGAYRARAAAYHRQGGQGVPAPTSFEALVKRRDGKPIYLHLDLTPIKTGNGAYILAIFHDITERKQDEERLRRYERQLSSLTAALQRSREDEQKRIAEEIHDEFGQQLTALKMHLAALGDIRGGAARLQPSLELVDGLTASVHRICSELRPALLDAQGIVAALRRQVEEFNKLGPTHCTFVSNVEELALSGVAAIALYRITQEALTNVRRHARAERAWVRLTVSTRQAVLRVEDDGVGVRPGLLHETLGLGLLGIRERAVSLGWRFAIGPSTRQRGTLIKITMPKTHEEGNHD